MIQALIKTYCHSRTIDLNKLELQNGHKHENELCVYTLFLPDSKGLVPQLNTVLDAAENIRAARFYQENDRSRYIICRGWLKHIVADLTGLDAAVITFEYNAFGKPYLACTPQLFFNVTHAGDYAFIIFSNRSVGIDIEAVRDPLEIEPVMAHVFNSEEIQNTLDSIDPIKCFYKYWTRKEALVKAMGRGIDDTLSQLSCLDGLNMNNFENFDTDQEFQIINFEFEGYMGAIALCSEHKIADTMISLCAPDLGIFDKSKNMNIIKNENYAIEKTQKTPLI